MEIRLHHPKHGYHVVHDNVRMDYLKSRGWSIDETYGKPVVKKIEPSMDDLVTAYIAKFGKKPHHMAKLETIQKALDDNSE